MAGKGQEERFPPTRLSAGCGFRKETIAGMRRNGRDAPIAVIYRLTGPRPVLDSKALFRTFASRMLGAPESGHSSWISSRQHVEQRLCVCQIRGIGPLGEPSQGDGRGAS